MAESGSETEEEDGPVKPPPNMVVAGNVLLVFIGPQANTAIKEELS